MAERVQISQGKLPVFGSLWCSCFERNEGSHDIWIADLVSSKAVFDGDISGFPSSFYAALLI